MSKNAQQKLVPPKDFYDPQYLKNARKSQWYDVVTRNLTKCPFCDLKDKYLIVDGKTAVLTVNLFPYIDGHLMVIPKRHLETFAGFTPKEWQEMHHLLNIGMQVVKAHYNIENTNILYREGNNAGASLGHAHLHIFPITPEFMKYDKQRFIYQFQDVKFAPHETAKQLRKTLKKLGL